MNATTQESRGKWLNPSMLEWARNWRGLSVEYVAKKMKKTPEQIIAWEENKAKPTVKQARKLADLYKRSFVEFFLSSPPKLQEVKTLPDFRMHKDVLEPFQIRDFKLLQQWAERQRESALDLYKEIGEEPTRFLDNIFATTDHSPEETAKIAREVIGFTESDQLNLNQSTRYLLPSIIRARLESLGILTLRNNELKNYGIRGLCIAEFPLPVIMVNNEAPTAQAFTLGHEFGHIILKASGLTGPRSKDYSKVPEERWCDKFAAAFLMPRELIEKNFGLAPQSPLPRIGDADLNALASAFRVSPHAMLIRLVHLKYIETKFYWDVKKPEFDQEEGNGKSFARAKYYGTRYRSKLGELYTGLVMEAWSTGRITNHNAAQYMGIKNLKHLNDIRQEYRPS